MSKIVKIDFNDLCDICKYTGVQYCKDSHYEVESFCKLSGIERKLCEPDICPLIIKKVRRE